MILGFREPRFATRAALIIGALEITSLLKVVWRVHELGAVRVGRYLRVDGLSSFFLINIAFISGLVLVYASGYMRHPGGGRFASLRWFYALVFLFLFTMISVCLSANLGLMWIMMEGTTLASALLVGFYNTKGAVEAGWKYLMVCTVGIAFALFGTIVLYIAAVKAGMNPASALDWSSSTLPICRASCTTAIKPEPAISSGPATNSLRPSSPTARFLWEHKPE